MTQQWISVKDRYPKPKSFVFAWVNNQTIKHFYTQKGSWVNVEEISLPKYYRVEFWMPLPDPPKETQCQNEKQT